MKLGIVIVHYHTPGLVGRAVEALRSDLQTSGLEGEILVVDNGSDASARAYLGALPVRYIDAGRNRGYAGGFNLGAAGTDAEILMLMNPDVLVLPGCLGRLAGALGAGAAAAGPRFYWDLGKRFLLPPTEERTRRAELRARLAGYDHRLAGWARRRWRLHARRFWLAETPFATECLSGALLAIGRAALERVGPFDESFQLYFEENDWLRRLRRSGLRALYVPDAEAVHLFNQSAAHEPAAAQWFAESRALFERRHYGRWFLRLLSALPMPGGLRPVRAPQLAPGLPRIDLSCEARGDDWPLWVEVSPSSLGFPAGASCLRDPASSSWSFPREIWPYLAPGRYLLTISGRLGQELNRVCFHRLPGQTVGAPTVRLATTGPDDGWRG